MKLYLILLCGVMLLLSGCGEGTPTDARLEAAELRRCEATKNNVYAQANGNACADQYAYPRGKSITVKVI